jgi:N6-L-threonylcarbamoyladenine synthase
MTGLPYPGGPEVDRVAAAGDPSVHHFPRARLDKDSLDFSFSGVKTSVRYRLRDNPELGEEANLPDLLAGFQESVVGVLVENSRRALARTGRRAMGVCGGVAANSRLRAAFQEMAVEEGVELIVPPPDLCTDNAAMVASAGDSALRAGRLAPADQGAFAHCPLPFES